MPPFLPRKRSTPPASPRPIPNKRARLADALDADATNNVRSLGNVKHFSLGSDDSSSESSLSDIDSDQFENIPVKAGKPIRKPSARNGQIQNDQEGDTDDGDCDDDDDDEDIEWEDAEAPYPVNGAPAHIPMANGPIQITLRNEEDDVIDYGTAAKAQNGKKGPSKREKQVRLMTHQLHVQFLLWHNAVRNSWIGDKTVQEVLIKQLPPQILNEVDKWRRASGLVNSEHAKPGPKNKKASRRRKDGHERNQRDWGKPSQRLEVGKPDMSHGDPLIILLKVLSAYWKKRFATTLPGLRKRGYGTKFELKQDVASLRNDEHDPERHGEKIRSLAEFRIIAQSCRGSRDVGAQLFTALLRGLGIEARLVASLQPSGYGWTKAEQRIPKKPMKSVSKDESSGEESPVGSRPMEKRVNASNGAKKAVSQRLSASRTSITIDLDSETDDGLQGADIKDDDSVIDVTPSVPKQKKPKYDRDLIFPIYWTEAISPITNKVIPVSPLVLQSPVAVTPETLSLFEPKGAKAEQGRQVMAYVIAYSPDGSAKDVTVRYLRKQIWPGKTKGSRMPVQKMPIYDKTGRIKRYETFDWFKATLSPYTRSDPMRTAVDDVEDSTDLVPQQSEKKAENEGIDTLQSLKSSADFVLERFLRREEALRPEAQPVRKFISGKGDKYKEENVYRRADVERCLTAESWHKEGRRPKLGEVPMKMVPVRAVTLTRKREAEEHERQYGEKQTQGLYSWDQSEWIIPPPIRDGIIPKNAYGNMDCFVPSMVPRGAVHIPLKGTVRICKKLEIDFAEAVTGFEFGNKRAVPVCTGVVVAKENETIVKEAWREWNEEQRRKEETKMEKLTLDLWRKFVLGLRIRERVQDMYGEDIVIEGDLPTGLTRDDAIAIDDEEHEMDVDEAGGFTNADGDGDMEGGFLLPHDDEPAPMEDLIMDDHTKPTEISNIATADENLQSDLSDAGSDASDSTGHGNDEGQNEHDSDTPPTDLTVQAPSSIRQRAAHQKAARQSGSRLDHNRIKKGRTILNADLDIVRSDTNASASKSESEEGRDSEDTEDDETQEEEFYTPRSTRTRGANQSTRSAASLPKSTATRSATKAKQPSRRRQNAIKSVKKQTEPKSKYSVNAVSDIEDEGHDSSEDDEDRDNVRSPATSRGQVTRRGRPRRETTKAVRKTAPKRSTRLLRKESTIVTSPYFET